MLVLVASQFVSITKARIEGILNAFGKLMGPDKQHTVIESDNVRYVYQALDNLYVLIVTNKASNILEDLETLQLLTKIIPECSPVLEENEILKNGFEIIFGFDEIISMGYKERVTIQQVKHFLAMSSPDEDRYLEEKKKKRKRISYSIKYYKKGFRKKREAIKRKRDLEVIQANQCQTQVHQIDHIMWNQL